MSPRSLALALATVVLVGCSTSVGPDTRTVDRTLSAERVERGPVRILAGLDAAAANAFNDHDEVVGTIGSVSAFRWRERTGVQLLPTIHNLPTRASGVNDRGEIVGTIDTDSTSFGVTWTRNGGPTILPLFNPEPEPPPPFNVCEAFAVNRTGQIVGRCLVHFASNFQSVQWDAQGHVSGVGAQPPSMLGIGGEARSISDNGFIGGLDADYTVAYIVAAGTEIMLPEVPFSTCHGCAPGSALSVNTHMQAAGYTSNGTCQRATVWLVTSAAIDVGTCGFANGIDEHAVVVGTGTDNTGNNNFAFIWTKNHGLRRLPGLGATGETSTAIAINHRHEALGTIVSRGVRHTVIWTLPHEDDDQGDATLAVRP